MIKRVEVTKVDMWTWDCPNCGLVNMADENPMHNLEEVEYHVTDVKPVICRQCWNKYKPSKGD